MTDNTDRHRIVAEIVAFTGITEGAAAALLSRSCAVSHLAYEVMLAATDDRDHAENYAAVAAQRYLADMCARVREQRKAQHNGGA
jgi:hypothetical protein